MVDLFMPSTHNVQKSVGIYDVCWKTSPDCAKCHRWDTVFIQGAQRHGQIGL